MRRGRNFTGADSTAENPERNAEAACGVEKPEFGSVAHGGELILVNTAPSDHRSGLVASFRCGLLTSPFVSAIILSGAKPLIRFLPTTNLFRRNPYLNDHVTGGDAGLYDLLLHSVDRAYTVPEIGTLASDAGLRVVAFLEPVRYEPATYMSDPVIARQASSLPLVERAAFAERLAGNLRTHVFYATRAGFDTVARPEDTSAIPVLRDMDAAKLAAGLQPGAPLVANLDGFPWRAQLPALAPRIISQFDGRRTVAEIYTSLGAQGGLPQWEDFYTQFEDLYVKLNGVNHLLLRFRT